MTKKETPLAESREVVKEMTETIKSTFNDFKVPIEIIEAIDGYRSYHFYLQPKKPMRMKAFAGYVEDLKYALRNDGVEIQAPVPNEKLVGVTVPKKTELPLVPLAEALAWEELNNTSPLTVPIGIDEFGEHYLLDIAQQPHLLVAGTTGSGKSVFLHSLINALVDRNGPEQLRFIFLDPKRIELTLYKDLPHLLTPPITQSRKAIQALSWAVKEMERRYDILEATGKQNITAYTEDIYRPAKEEWDKASLRERQLLERPEALPYILIVVDELNDFMQIYPQEMEACIVRLAQMSRPVGIHLILSTQRASTKVITGTIKANIPARSAFMVASQVDSRTILDTPGAEKLRGSGDMLLATSADPKLVRIQSPFISEGEIAKRVGAWKAQPDGDLHTLDFSPTDNDLVFHAMVGGEDGEEDDIYEDAKRAVIEAGKASTSYIQRKLRIGYSRAARLMDLLEHGGVIGPADGSAPREVLIDGD